MVSSSLRPKRFATFSESMFFWWEKFSKDSKVGAEHAIQELIVMGGWQNKIEIFKF